MARTVGIDFKFTGDPTKGAAAWRTIAQAAKSAGGDIAAAGRQMETAIRKAEAAAAQQQKSLSGALGGGAQSKAGAFLGGLADSLGVSEFVDQFGGVDELLGGISTRAAVAATGLAALGAVTVKLGVDSAKTYLRVVEQVDAVADVTGSTAKEASKLVGVFNGVGLSADTGAGALAKLAKAVATNEAGLLKYGIVVARNADGTTDLSGTLLNVASAYQATNDPAQKAAIGAAAFGKSWADMVDVLEKSRPKLDELMNLAPTVSDADFKRLEDFKQQMAALRKTGEDAKVTFGRPIIGATTAELERATGVIRTLGAAIQGDFSGAWDELNRKVPAARSGFASMADDLSGRFVAGALQAAYATDSLGRSVELASVRAANAAQRFAALFDTQTTAISAQVRFRDAVAGLADTQRLATQRAGQMSDAQDAVAKATGDQARAVSDGARRIADAEREAAEAVVDAQERVADARERAARTAQDSADRVADAERALRDAAAAGAGDNPLEQQRRIEEAQIDLARAKRDQVQAAEDGNKDISRSERDLAQAQEDGQRRIADARREAAEAQAQAADRVTEAQGRATAAVDVGAVSVGNMTGKVDDLVKSTYDAAYQTIQMGGSQADVKAKVDEAKRALEEYGPQLGLTAAQVEYYRKQLELIPLVVPTQIRVSFSVGSAMDVARRGLAAAIASTIQPPEFAGGGVFRAPGGGAGLAILHDGEKVLTPEQQQAGGGNTYNFYGFVGNERQLVEMIAKAERQGYRG